MDGTMNEDLQLFKRLEALRETHREIEEKLKEEFLDDFTRQRLKKEKLVVRQDIVKIENIVYPDVIA